MRNVISHFSGSKYFTKAFDTAIFDGPYRIYFSQHQESDVLNSYVRLQEKLEKLRSQLAIHRPELMNVYIMIYPDDRDFQNVFDTPADPIVETFGDDVVLAIRGPVDDKQHLLLEKCIENECIKLGA